MDIPNYTKQLIENKSDYVLTPEDIKTIQHEGIKKYIFQKLNSSKYKASAITPDYVQKVQDKIDLCVNHNSPIYITLPFGATKNPYLPTAPGIDWAEMFNLAYIREYLKPIAKAYTNGVILEYISVAVFEEKVNRISQTDTDLYDQQFQKLIEFYQQYLPQNFTLKYSRVSDHIPRDIIERQLEIKKSELRKTWDQQSTEVKEYKLLKAKRNLIYDPIDQYANDYILDSALGHDAFCSECWTLDAAPWDKKNMITLGHNYTQGWAIHVRSTYGSSVNFWSGIGVLNRQSDRIVPTVLSAQQYEGVKKNITQEKIPLRFDTALTNLRELPINQISD